MSEIRNFWGELPDEPPYVLPKDRAVVDAFNGRFGHDGRYLLQVQLQPEPFVGDPASPVYLLGLNPGYNPTDDVSHREPAFRKALRDNLVHGVVDYPYYFLNPKFAATSGAIWLQKRLRWILDLVSADRVAKKMFLVEAFPYHSHKFRRLPRALASSRFFPSCDYSKQSVRQAIADGKTIVLLRSFAIWSELVPELATYPKLIRLNSGQNVSLSPGNLPQFEMIIDLLSK